MVFDIVITSVEKDKFLLQHAIKYIKKYVKDFRRIIVVSNNKLTDIEGVEWFDENKYPFTKRDVYDNMYNYGEKRNRKCSYINQILKLYAHKVIPDLTENILICDSDIIFIKNITFMEDNKPIYGNRILDYGQIIGYFNHHQKLNEDFDFVNSEENKELSKNNKLMSGVCHHIMYNKHIINELISLIEQKHNCVFWKFYLNEAVANECEPANCELYYNYVCKYHKDKIIIRDIKWLERPAENGKQNNVILNFNEMFINDVKTAKSKNCRYIAYHSYNREELNDN
tara:strand:+ start:663 stop:1514 length:852 start_codon:yes stop_codon:yes gene_type:complete